MENLTICCGFISADRLCFQPGELALSGASRLSTYRGGWQTDIAILSVNTLKYEGGGLGLDRRNLCQGSVMESWKNFISNH